MSKVIHGSQILLEEAQKAFDVDNQKRGISFIEDCVEMLTNGLKRLQAEPAKKISAEHVSSEEAAEAEAERAATDQPAPTEQQVDSVLKNGGVLFYPKSKPDSGVVSEPDKGESKSDAGVVSEPEKSQNRDGSGVS